MFFIQLDWTVILVAANLASGLIASNKVPERATEVWKPHFSPFFSFSKRVVFSPNHRWVNTILCSLKCNNTPPPHPPPSPRTEHSHGRTCQPEQPTQHFMPIVYYTVRAASHLMRLSLLVANSCEVRRRRSGESAGRCGGRGGSL